MRSHTQMHDKHHKRQKSMIPGIIVVIIISSIFFRGCFWKKAKYDPLGYQYAETLQAEADELIVKAREPFYKHREAVYQLMTKVEYAYENARALKKNEAVTSIWNLLRDPLGNRLGKFMQLWEIEGQLDQNTINTYKTWIDDVFKKILDFENGKKK